ncbi:MAG: N-acetylmuramoyl-L-alanine amidase [Myxococcales bacterium]|nr:N-acetylmuramoyl-L-alanine amidase [Myxococcales bacterium]
MRVSSANLFLTIFALAALSRPARAGEEARPRLVTPRGAVVLKGEEARLAGGLVLPGEVFVQGTAARGLLDPDAVAEVGQGPGFPRLPASVGSAGIGAIERLRVVLDPGHGGAGKSQQGAIGARGTREKSITWQMATRIRRELSRLPGVEVIMTRAGDEDVSMAQRVELANRVGADLFVSVHNNGNVARWYRGLETFFHAVSASSEEARRVASAENSVEKGAEATGDVVASILQDMQRVEVLRDSSRMAYAVHERLVRSLGFPDHGVMQADFYVLRLTRMPAVLLEVGFITNPVEEAEVRKEVVQQKVAEVVREAVAEFRELLIRKQSGVEGAPGEPR